MIMIIAMMMIMMIVIIDAIMMIISCLMTKHVYKALKIIMGPYVAH